MNAAASFSQDEIRLAHELKAAGLPWHPRPGHYVWDGEPLIQHDSPFHDRVFFILDLKHFLRRSETIERLVESMVWLPTWEQCRVELADRSVPSNEVVAHLQATDAFANQNERLELYVLLLRTLA
ncbi:hypothetical protein [Neorhodopirellula pilleata]|uniref:Uncharacterized protein n=1 Tax=Neorhodopirellula pilleata TaxID=2714738 RepID=A0A5C6ADD4_9BACT|nr:hypothetical protein [Neorhodopirellula pilleata]TWT97450.1 hypothetical protein Pla100_26040 [Neorhodopirellula pilleata]